jgi:hypothetical protein
MILLHWQGSVQDFLEPGFRRHNFAPDSTMISGAINDGVWFDVA